MSITRSSLPTEAMRFLGTPAGQRAEPVMRFFHRWLANKRVALSGLRAAELDGFFARPFRKLVTPRTADGYKRRLILYLAWLHAQNFLSFDPKDLGIRYRRPLPPLACDFLRSLEPTRRLSTCGQYRTALRNFHEWLDDARIHLRRLSRAQIEQWFLALYDRGLHPQTRLHTIEQTRSYLRWLFERGELACDADTLVRRSDMPKLPQYLPRPLAPDVDLELQARLTRSSDPLWQGLLLMRNTGLRIGELRTLEFACVRTDLHGNHFLKVPLGKLENERLVPISDSTCRLIEALQRVGGLSRRHLLERTGGGVIDYPKFSLALRRAADGLHDGAPITTHRLRHSYATTLLNAGMSLVGVMKLLGHRDFRMTLRYTAITQETVGKEYFEALSRLEARYAAVRTAAVCAGADLNPIKALNDVVAWVKNRLDRDFGDARLASLLSKRLLRIRDSLATYAEVPPGTREN